MRLSPGTPSPGSSKFSIGRFSPEGLHVLVVDDDPLCLMVLERMLRQCKYNVTTCNRVKLALQLLRENRDEFDLVISDVYMPDEDGFKLLEVIGLELDLPVIMMSANGETSVVMQGITHGACDYLIKPIRIEELRNIWQHVIRRKGKDVQTGPMQGELDELSRIMEVQDQTSKKRKELLEMEDCSMGTLNSLKKARVNWSIELHRQFVEAVNQLGIDKAVPKRILDIMNVQGLTRENVASHLQKYRLYLKRLSGVVPEPCPIASFRASGDGTIGGTMLVQLVGKAPLPNSGVKGCNLGAGIRIGTAKDKKKDVGTMESLANFKSHQKQHAANRAQVLGGLGLSDTRSSADFPAAGIHRMGSLDLSFFLQPECVDSMMTRESVDALDDLAACSFRAVKLEDDVGMSAGMCVSGVNSKRTYPSRQTGSSLGHRIGQWNEKAYDSAEEEKKLKQVESLSVANKVVDLGCGESRSFGMVVDNSMGHRAGVGTQETHMHGVDQAARLTGIERTQSIEGYNADLTKASSGIHKAMGVAMQQHYRQSMGMFAVPAPKTTIYTSSSMDLADDAASSTNVDLSTSSFTETSGDCFSESSFSALAQLGGIMSPPPTNASTHLMHNNELDIADYLQLDDGFGF